MRPISAQLDADFQTIVPGTLALEPRARSSIPALLRAACALLTRAWLRIVHGLRIEGRGHIPLEHSCIIVANHTSHLDTLCILAALPLHKLHDAHPAAAADYFFRDSLRSALATLVTNAIPLDRNGAARQSMSLCRRILDVEGSILIVYPEGTRGDGASIRPFKRGVGDLVAGRDIPVVPCHIEGASAAWPKDAVLPRPARVRVRFGRPRHYAHLRRCKLSAQRISQDLRRAVIELAPRRQEEFHHAPAASPAINRAA